MSLVIAASQDQNARGISRGKQYSWSGGVCAEASQTQKPTKARTVSFSSNLELPHANLFLNSMVSNRPLLPQSPSKLTLCGHWPPTLFAAVQSRLRRLSCCWKSYTWVQTSLSETMFIVKRICLVAWTKESPPEFCSLICVNSTIWSGQMQSNYCFIQQGIAQGLPQRDAFLQLFVHISAAVPSSSYNCCREEVANPHENVFTEDLSSDARFHRVDGIDGLQIPRFQQLWSIAHYDSPSTCSGAQRNGIQFTPFVEVKWFLSTA